ncbi:MAG: serine hydrolase domain-containing protein [Trebonia sp.]|uniref:serine hydrolase domain-containing protein n=8 Tax=Trebonia sp. TaxID=2767075 RepID=UPI003BD5310C
MRSDFAAVDAIVSHYFDRGAQPAISYGVVSGGVLVHSAGFGARGDGRPAPDADTVFRIASMSKSFTASAVLLLRDEGRLALDDPAEKYVPELAGWPSVTPDSDRVTIRHLLTMTAGFPTDDPWGDRQQGLPLDAFGALLAGGVRFNWAPGTRFEYSNLGYAILGRIVAAAAQAEYAGFVATRLLAPLGMARTGYDAAGFDPGELATGYRRGPAGWAELPFDPYGAFAPMGGVFSSVSDLARWVAGFAAAFPPGGGSDADGTHPLRRASRREMQQPQAVTGWRSPDRLPGGPPGSPAYYGFGLFVDEDPVLGRVVSHSGGYPGFGSNMRWHPATGLGVIALGNGTYAPMSVLAGLVLEALLPRPASYHVALSPADPDSPSAPSATPVPPAGAPWPETLAAASEVSRLLANWDDAAADALFSENVALDAPYQERRRALELIRQRIGDFRADDTRAPESDTPAHRRWWLTGPRGTVQAQILLNPERPPRVQSLALAVPPASDSVLATVLTDVVTWLNTGAAQWPGGMRVAPGTDEGLLRRRLLMAAAWAGTCRTGAYRAGDGAASVSVELAGEHATVVLSLLVNPGTGEIRQADVAL